MQILQWQALLSALEVNPGYIWKSETDTSTKTLPVLQELSEYFATETPHCPLSPLWRIKEIKGRTEWLQLYTHCLWRSCYLCFTTGSSPEPTIPFMASSILLGSNTWDEACSWCSCTVWGGPVSGPWCRPVHHLSRILSSHQSWLLVLSRCPCPAVCSQRRSFLAPSFQLCFYFHPWVLQPCLYSHPFFFHWFFFSL